MRIFFCFVLVNSCSQVCCDTCIQHCILFCRSNIYIATSFHDSIYYFECFYYEMYSFIDKTLTSASGGLSVEQQKGKIRYESCSFTPRLIPSHKGWKVCRHGVGILGNKGKRLGSLLFVVVLFVAGGWLPVINGFH